MQAARGRRSSGWRKKRLWIPVCGGVLLTIAVLWLLYWAVAAPIISFCTPNNGIYEDLSLYTEDAYKQFENADIFESYMKTFEFPAESEVVAFYYVDNHQLDNPIYGKMSDVFAVDYHLSQQMYDEYKIRLSFPENYVDELAAFELYLSDVPVGEDNFGVVAFNDKECIVRCCLVTSVGDISTTVEDRVRNILWYRSTLNWGEWEDG